MTIAMLSSLLALLGKGNSSAECFPSMQFTTLSVVLLSGADLRGLLITLLSLRIFEKKKVVNIISHNFYEYYSNELYMLKEDLSLLSLYHN